MGRWFIFHTTAAEHAINSLANICS